MNRINIGDGQLNSHETNLDQAAPPEETMLPPLPPDGGWGWIVVCSSFMCYFITGKCLNTLGDL